MAEDAPDQDGTSRPTPPDQAGSEAAAELRTALAAHWQAAALALVRRGVPADAVFETLFTVGTAGLIESRGRREAAHRLLNLAEQLTEQLRREAAALDEAQRATKN